MIEFIVAAAAVIGAIGVIWQKAVRPIARAVKHVHLTYDQIMEYGGRLSEVEKRSLELMPNSGTSLRDAVDRIEIGQRTNAENLAAHIEWGQAELVKIWQSLAAKDAVEAAKKTAEAIAEATENERGSNGMDA